MVDDGGDDCNGNVVGHQKHGPESWTLVEDAHYLEEHDDAEAEEYFVSVGCQVWVAELVDLDESEHGDDVHECGVKLEVLAGRADVVAGA